MNSFKTIIPLLVFPLFFLACQEERHIIEERPYEQTLDSAAHKRKWKPDTAVVQKHLTKFFAEHQVGDSFQVDTITFTITAMLAELYRQQDCKPLWSDEAHLGDLIKILRTSEFDGLLPNDYHWLLLVKAKEDWRLGKLNDSTFVYAELMATASFLTYARDMWVGKVDPAKIYLEWNYEKRTLPENAPLELLNILNGPLENIPAKLRPQAPVYGKLRKSFMRLDSLERRGLPWPTITYPGRDLSLGDTLCTIAEAKTRFRNMSIYDGDSSTLFDEKLVVAVKEFQRMINISQSGKLDKATVARLNFTIEEVRNTIRVNMERCRWLLHSLPDYYVVVNIASYTLNVMEKAKVKYSSRVIVGREQTMTPVFQANMSQIIFNPDWSVPLSIIDKEILPALKKNPGYLASHRMQLMRGDAVIDPYSVDFAAYTPKNFPYSVRQLPGDDNALGHLKFIMPNPYSIYLHDTPSRYLFKKEERAFSHGCIRVDKPTDLAAVLLKPLGYNREWIDKQIASKQTYVLALTKKIPIMLTYWTCYEDRSTGGLQFFPDIYGRDGEILRGLNK